MITLRRMRWVGHVAHEGDEICQNFVRELVGKIPLGRPRFSREDVLKWISVKYGRRLGTGFIWLTTGIGGGLL
jgi:hypothetical protein